MLLPIETWSAAWFWLACWKTCSIVWPCSASRCSSHVTANTSAGPCPCRRLANSATNALVSGGFSRTMSARTSTTLAGSLADTSSICSTQYAARSRSQPARHHVDRHPPQVLQQRQPQHDRDRPQLAEPQRLRTDWYAATNARRLSASTRPSAWEISSSAMS